MAITNGNRATGDGPVSGKSGFARNSTVPHSTELPRNSQPSPFSYLRRAPGSWQHVGVVAERVLARVTAGGAT